MSTPFESIYELNSVIRLDSRIQSKPTNLIYQLYFRYLTFAISYFADDCYKDITKYTPFSQTEYEYVADGLTNKFTLIPSPPADCNLYVSINGVENTSYTFDNMTNELVFSATPANEDVIYIGAYIIGEFEDTLNEKEKVILAEGMNCPWLEEKLNTNTLLNQVVYGKDYKIYSQGEHIRELNKTWENQYYKNVKTMIREYSYKQNTNALYGLGGGLIGS